MLICGLGGLDPPAGAAGIPGIPPGASQVNPAGVGITVSWSPTSGPVGANRGGETHGTFWVTNQNAVAIPVSIEPLTAHPQNNGNLTVTKGADPQFTSISYSPSSFLAAPRTTTAIDVLIDTPPHLPPGVYLLPAGVVPSLPPSVANVHIRETIVALVTVKASGTIDAHVRPTFLGPVSRPGVASAHHLPGMVPIQFATSGSEELRVFDDSKSSFYATNEITASQRPFGEVVFRNHTPGIPDDLRNPPALYFPGTYRDFPVTWRSTSLGFGAMTADAYIGFQPNPGELVHVGVSTQALLVSPLWILTMALFLLILLLRSDRLARRQLGLHRHRALKPSTWRALFRLAGSSVVVIIIAAAAFLAIPLIFLGVGAAGLVLWFIGATVARHQDRAQVARLTRGYEGMALALVMAGVVAVVLSALSLWTADLAMGILAGSGVWVAVTWWTLWWNDGRTRTQDTVMNIDLPPGPADPVPAAVSPDPAPDPAPVAA